MPDRLDELAESLLQTLGKLQQSIQEGRSKVGSPLAEELDGAVRRLCAAVRGRIPFDGGQVTPESGFF